METFFPLAMVAYLAGFRQAFSKPAWRCFQGWMWGVLIVGGRKCTSRIAAGGFFIERSLSGWERYLAEHQWDLVEMVGWFSNLLTETAPSRSRYGLVRPSSSTATVRERSKVSTYLPGQMNHPEMVKQQVRLLKEKLGARLQAWGSHWLALDAKLVAKVEGKMPGVRKWKDHSGNPERGGYLTGHHWMVAALLSRWQGVWLAWPLVMRLISGKRSLCLLVVKTQ